VFLKEQALAQKKVDSADKAENFVKTAPASWIEETIASKYINEEYGTIATLGQLESLVGEKLSSSVLGEK
jgi:hypothetical protein